LTSVLEFKDSDDRLIERPHRLHLSPFLPDATLLDLPREATGQHQLGFTAGGLMANHYEAIETRALCSMEFLVRVHECKICRFGWRLGWRS
jgi:hypothetical protein